MLKSRTQRDAKGLVVAMAEWLQRVGGLQARSVNLNEGVGCWRREGEDKILVSLLSQGLAALRRAEAAMAPSTGRRTKPLQTR